MAKIITFILPGSSGAPSGGSRIVYEYANRLSLRGHKVCVVHAPVTRIDAGWKMIGKAIIRYPQRLMDRSYRPDRWFAVEPAVEVRWVPTLSERYIPNADVVVATAWKTAEWVAAYSSEKGRKFYFIQGYEDWDTAGERVNATWKLPLEKIVIARWLQDIAKRLGESAAYVPNAIDQGGFHLDIEPAQKDPGRVAMLYHAHPWKGAEDGLRALEMLKNQKPELKAALFGVPKRPVGLPSWIEYCSNPSQQKLRQLYNEAAVFLAPSHTEGWGLTALEAMACGAAVVATANRGYLEFAVDCDNALIVKVKDHEGMASALGRLIDDHELRLTLARNGMNTAENFSWNKSVDGLENILLG